MFYFHEFLELLLKTGDKKIQQIATQSLMKSSHNDDAWFKNTFEEYNIKIWYTELLQCCLAWSIWLPCYFLFDAKYMHPGTKSISRHDFLTLLCIDAAFMLYFLFRKKVLNKYKASRIRSANNKLSPTSQSLTPKTAQ